MNTILDHEKYANVGKIKHFVTHVCEMSRCEIFGQHQWLLLYWVCPSDMIE